MYDTVEFMVSKKSDTVAAKIFFRKAFNHNPMRYRVNIDKSLANKAALDHFNKPGILTGKRNFILSQAKYLNNIVEQDHRHIKLITSPMGVFRKMHTVSQTIEGIELMNMIHSMTTRFTFVMLYCRWKQPVNK